MPSSRANPHLSLYPEVLESASRLAARGHHRQFRKRGPGSRPCSAEGAPLPEDCVPYVTHLAGVACILARVGAGPEVLAAALLHDYLEDVPDSQGRTTVEAAVGIDVLQLVLEVTEDKRRSEAQADTWTIRKKEAVGRIASMSEEAVLIKAADMLHNLSSMVYDFKLVEDPSGVWGRFNAGADSQLWYYDAVYRAVAARLGLDHPLVEDLAMMIDEVSSHQPG